MATRRVTTSDTAEVAPRRGRPATTPEAREQELIALAYDVVETRLRKGTASSQETTHFLKMGSVRESVEQERIRGEVLLNAAKIESMESHKRMEDLYVSAISAMQSYAPERPASSDEEFND